MCNGALSRRLALAAGGAAALGVGFRTGRASAEDEEQWTRYTRAFRERFETSISSATRAYTFEHPASWGPGAMAAKRGRGAPSVHSWAALSCTAAYRGRIVKRWQVVRSRFAPSQQAGGRAARGLAAPLWCAFTLAAQQLSSSGHAAHAAARAVGRDTLADAGTPKQALDTFEELIGAFWESNGFGRSGNAGALVSAEALTKDKQLYYRYETDSHNLIAANATDGQLYLLTVSASNDRSFKRNEKTLRRILDSFAVPA